MSDDTFYIYGCFSHCRVFADLSAVRSQGANIYPASPIDGAPKWAFRVVSLNKWLAS
jgi:hypothetical protein